MENRIKYVVSNKNLPSRLPVFSAITTYLALEHFNAPEWLYGAIGLFFLLAFIGSIYSIVMSERVEIFPPTEEDRKEGSKFDERLRKAMKIQKELNDKNKGA